MPATDETLLCHYHFDPLDRLADCTTAAQPNTQRFYLKNLLVSEIQGSVQQSIFQHDDQLLAQQHRKNEISTTTLLATDQQRSVLHTLDAAQLHPLAYTAYGHRPQENGLLSLLGFNGERPDPVTGHYLLGNGYRAFNPMLMRFNSPDSLSPFGKGGLNAYAYCVGDPVNRSDPTGHTWRWLKSFLRGVGLMSRSASPIRPLPAPRNPLATTGALSSSQPPSPTASLRAIGNLDEKSPAWTTANTAPFHVHDLPVRRGSHSYYLEAAEASGSPSLPGTPSQTPRGWGRVRAAVQGTRSLVSRLLGRPRAAVRGTPSQTPGGWGRVRAAVRNMPRNEEISVVVEPPPAYEPPPSYPEAIGSIRRS